MSKVSIENVLVIIATVLQVDKSVVEADSTIDDIEEWESIKSMEIVLALEEEYEIYFSENALEEMIDVPSIMKHLNLLVDDEQN